MKHLLLGIDGDIRDTRLEEEPTDEKIRITNMRLDLEMQMNGMKKCTNCNAYGKVEEKICRICLRDTNA